MKNIFTLVLILIASAAMAQAKVVFDRTTHNFGRFNEGPDSVCVFTVKNTGTAPLILVSVSTPCGCTKPEFTKAPIQPGTEGTIMVKYSSSGHPGVFEKRLQVITNDPLNEAVTITIRGDVVPKAAQTTKEAIPTK